MVIRVLQHTLARGSGHCSYCWLLPEFRDFGEWCQKDLTHFSMMHCTVVFGYVVSIVDVHSLQFEFKLLLHLIIPESVQANAHCLGPLWLDGVVDDSLIRGIVSVDVRVGLWLSWLS